VADDPTALAAGDAGSWLDGMRAALRGDRDADVPCGPCTACCTSSQFVHVAPDETDALAHIPHQLLFPAPLAPRGHVLLGYDERGHCPMLVDGACSIYEHRPRTCRTYDCRVFAAADVAPDDDKPLIAAQAARWRFTGDGAALDAVRAAAAFVRDRLDGDDAPRTATPLAVVAVELGELFAAGGATVETVRVELRRRRRGS